MTTLTHLSDDAVMAQLHTLVRSERDVTAELLRYLSIKQDGRTRLAYISAKQEAEVRIALRRGRRLLAVLDELTRDRRGHWVECRR